MKEKKKKKSCRAVFLRVFSTYSTTKAEVYFLAGRSVSATECVGRAGGRWRGGVGQELRCFGVYYLSCVFVGNAGAGVGGRLGSELGAHFVHDGEGGQERVDANKAI